MRLTNDQINTLASEISRAANKISDDNKSEYMKTTEFKQKYARLSKAMKAIPKEYKGDLLRYEGVDSADNLKELICDRKFDKKLKVRHYSDIRKQVSLYSVEAKSLDEIRKKVRSFEHQICNVNQVRIL